MNLRTWWCKLRRRHVSETWCPSCGWVEDPGLKFVGYTESVEGGSGPLFLVQEESSTVNAIIDGLNEATGKENP